GTDTVQTVPELGVIKTTDTKKEIEAKEVIQTQTGSNIKEMLTSNRDSNKEGLMGPSDEFRDEEAKGSLANKHHSFSVVTENGTGKQSKTQDIQNKNHDLTPSTSDKGDTANAQVTRGTNITAEGYDTNVKTKSPQATTEQEGTTEEPEMATILIPYSFVQFLGHASTSSHHENVDEDPAGKIEELQPPFNTGGEGPEHPGTGITNGVRDRSPVQNEGNPDYYVNESSFNVDDNPVDYTADRPFYGGGETPASDGGSPQNNGGNKPFYNNEESLVYGGEEIPAHGDEESSVHGKESLVYGEESPLNVGESQKYVGGRPVYDGEAPVYGEGRPVYGEEKWTEAAGRRPVYGAGARPVHVGVERPEYGWGENEAHNEERPTYGEETPVHKDEVSPLLGNQEAGGLSRKDDSGAQEYGGDSPFFIKLPGSPNAVPVFLQYEPIQIKYIPSEQLDKKGEQEHIGDESNEGISEPIQDSQVTDVSMLTMEERNKTKEDSDQKAGTGSLGSALDRILDDSAATFNTQVVGQQTEDKEQKTENFIPHKPIIKAPDPFFLMEAPQLGKPDQPPPHTHQHSSHSHENEDYSVDLSSKLSFGSGRPEPQEGTAGTVEDVPLGTKQEILYPGDYDSHDAYTGVNLSSLMNPVFELVTKTTTMSHEDRMNPQYTPFPITTNAPRLRANPIPMDILSVLATPRPKTTDTQGVSHVFSGSTNQTSTLVTQPTSTITKTLPSVEYSPIPAVNFEDSYDSPFIPHHFFDKENQILAGNSDLPEGYPLIFHGLPHNLKEDASPDNTRWVSALPYKTSDAAVHSTTQSTQQNSDEYRTTTTIITTNTDEAIISTHHSPPPSEHLKAHHQEWVFPQSRQEPDTGEYYRSHHSRVKPGRGSYYRYHSRQEPGEGNSSDRLPQQSPARVYSAFYSPREIPGIDPAVFSYRKVSQAQPGDSEAPVLTYDTPLRQEAHQYQQQQQQQQVSEPSWSGGTTSDGDPAQHPLLGPQFFQ
ncbi:hypothetical protein OTU49_008896, partial [Cherax quadricarinatus]